MQLALLSLLLLLELIFLITHSPISITDCWEFREDLPDLTVEEREAISEYETLLRQSRILRRHLDTPYHDAESMVADGRFWSEDEGITPVPYLHRNGFVDDPEATLQYRLDDSRAASEEFLGRFKSKHVRKPFPPVCMHCLETDGFYYDPTENLLDIPGENGINFLEDLSGWDQPGWANRDRGHLYRDPLFSPSWTYDFFVRDTALYDTYSDAFDSFEPELQVELLFIGDAIRESFSDLWHLVSAPVRLPFRFLSSLFSTSTPGSGGGSSN